MLQERPVQRIVRCTCINVTVPLGPHLEADMAQKPTFRKALKLEKESLCQLTDGQTQQVNGAGGTVTYGEVQSCWNTRFHICISIVDC
jgi:hypothetical protein